MTHDPSCRCRAVNFIPENECPECSLICQCKLISKVRADERLQESARRAEKFGYWHDYRPELP